MDIRYLVKKHRRNNSYCKFNNIVKEEHISEILRENSSIECMLHCWNYQGKYTWVNINSFWEYGTVEFRCHEATTNLLSIINWIILTSNIVYAAQNYDYSKLAEKFLMRYLNKNIDNRKIYRLCTLPSMDRLLKLGKTSVPNYRYFQNKWKVYRHYDNNTMGGN